MYATVEDTFKYMWQIMPENSLLIETGVFNGNTMKRLIEGAEKVGKPFKEVWGFDSFIGLPEETEGVWHNPEWTKGAFSVCHDYKLATPTDAMKFVRERVGREDIRLIPGFFHDTLTDKLGKSFENECGYLHVDVDIHRSTYEVLKWAITNKILMENALVRFDDWLYNGQNGGNNLAFVQITHKYNVEWEKLEDNLFFYKGSDI